MKQFTLAKQQKISIKFFMSRQIFDERNKVAPKTVEHTLTFMLLFLTELLVSCQTLIDNHLQHPCLRWRYKVFLRAKNKFLRVDENAVD